MSPSIDSQVACLFMTNQEFVKGLAAHHAPWPGVADDIVQQVFLEFASKSDQWDLTSDIRPLLAVMTQNIAKRYWKEKLRTMPETLRQLAETLERSAENDPLDEEFEERRLALHYCLDKLPPKSRSLIDLRYFGAMTPKQVAEYFQLTVATVNQTIYRLRMKLHGCIERRLKGGGRDV